MEISILLLSLSFLFVNVSSRCSFRVLDDGKPLKIDEEPHIVDGLTQCVEYNGKEACCDYNNDVAQARSYTEIDGIFGSLGDGCDVCAINLKRFWC